MVEKDNGNIDSSSNKTSHKSKSILVHIIEISLIKRNGMEERVCNLIGDPSLTKENSALKVKLKFLEPRWKSTNFDNDFIVSVPVKHSQMQH